MFVTPVTIIPNPGSGKDVEKKQVHLPPHVVASSTAVQMLQQTPTQVKPSTSTKADKEDFLLYFIFEDTNPHAAHKFLKYVLRIRSSSCTVSQQKAAWAYLLYHIMSNINVSSDFPYAAMANGMKTVYYNKFHSALQSSPIFPLLKSFILLDAATEIKGFDMPDTNHGVYSIIEHFKIHTKGNAAQHGSHKDTASSSKIPKFPQNTVVKLPKKPPQTVKECLNAKRNTVANAKVSGSKSAISLPIPLPHLAKIRPKVTTVTGPIPTQGLNTISVTSTNSNPIISTGPILADGLNVLQGNPTATNTVLANPPILADGVSTKTVLANAPMLADGVNTNTVLANPPILADGATTNTVLANPPILADGVNTFPVNIVQLQTSESNANTVTVDSVTVSQDDNVINLDEYNKGGGMVAVQDLNKMMLGSMSITVPVIPFQGVIPLQNYQEVASSDSNFYQIATQSNQTNTPQEHDLTNKQEIPTVSVQSFQTTHTTVQNAHTQGVGRTQNVVIAPMPQAGNVAQNAEQPGSRNLTVTTGQTTIGQVPMNSNARVPSKPRKRKNTVKEALGPTLKLNQLTKLQAHDGMSKGKALVVQGTQEVVIVSDSADNNMKETLKPKLLDTKRKQTKGIDLEISVSKFKVKKDVFVPPPHHLSLFDSSILKNSGKAQVSVSDFTDTTGMQEIEVESTPILPEPDQPEPMNFSNVTVQKPVKRSAKIRDMIDLTKEITTKAVQSQSQKPIDLAIQKGSQVEEKTIASSSADTQDLATMVASSPGSRKRPLQTSQPGVYLNTQRKILPKPTPESVGKSVDSERKLKRAAPSGELDMPQEKVMKLEENPVSVSSQKVESHVFIDLSEETSKKQEQKNNSGNAASNTSVKEAETLEPAQKSVVTNSEASAKPTTSSPDLRMNDVKFIMPSIVAEDKGPYRTVYTIARNHAGTKSPSKHIPCIITSNKPPQTVAKTESDENTKRMTASNRWKFSKQRVHVAKREVVVETQHDLLIQPEPTPRRKPNRRKAKKEILRDEELEEDLTPQESNPVEKVEKFSAKQKSPDKKVKPPPSNAFREEKIGNKVYTWVPMKRRVGIMSRSLVDKDGNKVYKSKAKTNKFFSISKKRMMDLGLKGNEGRPLSPSSELENRKKALCKTMKLDDLVDRTSEQAVFLSVYSLISKQKLESACAEISEGRTSRKRQIKAPSRYDL